MNDMRTHHGPREVSETGPLELDPLFNAILVGTDGSPNAEEAVRQAARLAALTGAGLVVAFVGATGAARRGTVDVERTRGDHALEVAFGLAAHQGVVPEVRLLAGDPVTRLVWEARERWADLIVVGSDAGFLQKPRLFGRVAAHTIRQAHCSVLVARVPVAGRAGFPERILCAVDGSAGALAAVRRGARIARLAGSGLHVVHVLPVQAGPVGWSIEEPVSGFDPHRPAVDVARTRDVEAVSLLRMGRPEAAIALAAEDLGADLVVVGSRGLHGMRRTLLGSVSEWVGRHASCSVLISRERDR